MARIIKPGALTGASGRVGNLVTYELNGVQVVRTLPAKKKKKPTQSQQIHRQSFKKMHLFAKSVKIEIIDRIWSHLPASGGRNAYNMFIKTNRTAFGQHYNIVFPDLLVVSKGDLYPAEGFQAKKTGDGLQFSWTNNCNGQYAMPGDRLNVVILHHRSELEVLQTDATREDKVATLPADESVTEGYAFWASQDDTSFSPSVYWRV